MEGLASTRVFPLFYSIRKAIQEESLKINLYSPSVKLAIRNVLHDLI